MHGYTEIQQYLQIAWLLWTKLIWWWSSLSTDPNDFTDTGCANNIQLRLFPSAQRTSEVGINAVADDKIEGTEVLILRLMLTSATQTAINNAGNIFLQDTLNIRVVDVTGNYKLIILCWLLSDSMVMISLEMCCISQQTTQYHNFGILTTGMVPIFETSRQNGFLYSWGANKHIM